MSLACRAVPLGMVAALFAALSPLMAQVPGVPPDPAADSAWGGGPGQPIGEWAPSSQAPSAEQALDYIFTPHPHEGFFVQYDYLYWTVNSPNHVVVGDRDSEHVLVVNGLAHPVRNTLTLDWDDSDWGWGHRIDFGCVEQGSGWTASVLYGKQTQANAPGAVTMALDDPWGLLLGYQDANGDGYDDDMDGDAIYGRSGEDLGSPNPAPPPDFIAPFDGVPDAPTAQPDMDDMVEYIVTFGSLRAANSTTVSGIELMRTSRSPMSARGDYFELSWGLRYLRIRDQFDVSGVGGVLGSSWWSARADNDILGPQIGARWVRDFGAWRFAAEGRFLLGVNFQDTRLRGRIATEAESGGVNQPINLYCSSFFSSMSKEEFAPVGEVRLETAYKISEHIALRIGYTGLFAGGVSRGSPKIRYTLPAFQLADVDSLEGVASGGLHVGVELNR